MAMGRPGASRNARRSGDLFIPFRKSEVLPGGLSNETPIKALHAGVMVGRLGQCVVTPMNCRT